MTQPPHQSVSNQSETISKEFEEFMAIEPDLATDPRPNHSILALKDRLGSELVSSRWALCSLYFALSGAGYLLSLSLCAQNTNGLTPFAHHVEHWMHSFGPAVCGLICGFIFSGIPLGFSLLIIGRFRRRFLIARELWFVQLTTVIAASLLLLPFDWLQSNASHLAFAHRENTARILTWSLTAVIVPVIVTKIFQAVILIKTRVIKHK